jgi:peptidoglycan/LPS O-acetylase OafA/YrhL
MTQILERIDAPPVVPRGRRRTDRLEVSRRFRPDIEGIRAFAVLSVVLYHAGLGVRAGFVGVDVFFVISGFLITRQLVDSVAKRGVRSLPTFYTRRIRRLLPAGAVVVISTVLVARLFAPALQVRSIALDGIFTTFYGLNYRLAITGTQYLHQTDAVSPLQHFWSLGVEEQFYVFWPVLIVLVAWIGRRFRTALLALLLVATVVVSFHYSMTVTRSSAPWAYFSLHTRAWEMALGALVAVGAQQLARLPRLIGEVGAVIGLVVIVSSAFVYSDATPYPGSAAALPVAGAALLIASGCGPRRRTERILGEPMLQCIGRVSYSWYLWHWPMLVLAPMVIGHPLDLVQRLIVVWLSLATAVLTFFVIEDPARALRLTNLRWFAGGLAISGAVAAAGALVLTHLPPLVGTGAAVTIVQADTASPQVRQQMQAAVAAGVQTTNVPSNLAPQPAAAANDTPESSKDGCHADFLSTQQGDCVFGDPRGTHTAVIFGDSHAEQWLPAFDNAGRKAGWRIVNWTKAACPPAQISVFAASLNRDYSECDSWRTATMARIAALKPDLIVVSESENVVPSKVPPAEFATDTVTTLQKFQATSKAKVVFLSDIPVPNYDMPGCVAQHLDNAKACNFAVKNAYIYPERHKEMAPAIQRAGFAVVDPLSWLCTSSTCPAVVGNYLVYRNTTHMSASFATWLTPMVAPLLTVAK